jgi:hypothetical protein
VSADEIQFWSTDRVLAATNRAIEKAKGTTIAGVELITYERDCRARGWEVPAVHEDERDDLVALFIRFSDGTALKIADDANHCCERRYLTCDDDLANAAGAIFIGLQLNRVDDGPGERDAAHDVGFLEVLTSHGSFTVCTHNEHNGCYAGFSVWAEIIGAAEMP